eukprot:symbB.v1.2.005540.t1/scaffold308.1/size235111/3
MEQCGLAKVKSMDSDQLEQERGITILAKNAAVTYKGIKVSQHTQTSSCVSAVPVETREEQQRQAMARGMQQCQEMMQDPAMQAQLQQMMQMQQQMIQNNPQMQQQIAMMQAQLGGQVPGAQLPMAQAQVVEAQIVQDPSAPSAAPQTGSVPENTAGNS